MVLKTKMHIMCLREGLKKVPVGLNNQGGLGSAGMSNAYWALLSIMPFKKKFHYDLRVRPPKHAVQWRERVRICLYPVFPCALLLENNSFAVVFSIFVCTFFSSENQTFECYPILCQVQHKLSFTL